MSRFELTTRNTPMVCLLHWQVGKRFTDWGVQSPCSQHRHVKRAIAESLVVSGEAAWTGKGQNVATLRQPLMEPKGDNGHTWAMFRVANENKRSLCTGGLVSPR